MGVVSRFLEGRRLGKVPKYLEWARDISLNSGVNRKLSVEKAREKRTGVLASSHINRVTQNLAQVFRKREAVDFLERMARKIQEEDREPWHSPRGSQPDYRSYAETLAASPHFLHSIASAGICYNASLMDLLHEKGFHHGLFRHHLKWSLIHLATETR